MPIHQQICCCEHVGHNAAAHITWNNPIADLQIYTGGAGEGGGFQQAPLCVYYITLYVNCVHIYNTKPKLNKTIAGG